MELFAKKNKRDGRPETFPETFPEQSVVCAVHRLVIKAPSLRIIGRVDSEQGGILKLSSFLGSLPHLHHRIISQSHS